MQLICSLRRSLQPWEGGEEPHQGPSLTCPFFKAPPSSHLWAMWGSRNFFLNKELWRKESTSLPLQPQCRWLLFRELEGQDEHFV